MKELYANRLIIKDLRYHADAIDANYGSETNLTQTLRYTARKLEALTEIVDAQANDDGLWFFAETASEAYLQQELRRLHAEIEC